MRLERERETEKETDILKDGQMDREIDTQRDIEMKRDRDTERAMYQKHFSNVSWSEKIST